MLRFAIDGITSFSTVPLRIATWIGVLAGIAALGGGAWALWAKVSGHYVVRGWTTIMILVGLGSSAQLLMTGILGEYVGRIYEEVKRRPLYVVDAEVNLPRRDAAPDAGAPAPSPRH
jgi:dolichol-phosphate mannosyltransferase